jgi:hypothetical protein
MPCDPVRAGASSAPTTAAWAGRLDSARAAAAGFRLTSTPLVSGNTHGSGRPTAGKLRYAHSVRSVTRFRALLRLAPLCLALASPVRATMPPPQGPSRPKISAAFQAGLFAVPEQARGLETSAGSSSGECP